MPAFPTSLRQRATMCTTALFLGPMWEKKVKLSDERSRSAAEQAARLLSTFKGSGGGRFYVNEFCSVFSPVNGMDGLRYLSIGQIDLTSWFP